MAMQKVQLHRGRQPTRTPSNIRVHTASSSPHMDSRKHAVALVTLLSPILPALAQGHAVSRAQEPPQLKMTGFTIQTSP